MTKQSEYYCETCGQNIIDWKCGCIKEEKEVPKVWKTARCFDSTLDIEAKPLEAVDAEFDLYKRQKDNIVAKQNKLQAVDANKEQTVEEAAELAWYNRFQSGHTQPSYDDGFTDGAQWQQSKKQAEFIKLIEGEIATYFDPEKAGSLPRGVSVAITNALTDLLTKYQAL
jgi:hypothetical protein